MKEDRFLVNIDILGFEKLPQELSEKTGLYEDSIRDNLILKPFHEKIEEWINNPKYREIYVYKGTDDCKIITSDINLVFQILNEFFEIVLPIKGDNVKKLPLEIAIDSIKYNDNIKEQISSTEIIKSLKKNLLKKYRDNYKENYKESIKESFIVITESFFEKLEIYQKKECKKLELDTEVIYSLPLSLITREYEITDFLNKIGKSRNDASGALIDKVFVPPHEYDEILNSLENERIVFLTGPPGYGKTYLTIRLLWLWYKKGFNPIWIKGDESNERSEGRSFLEDIDANNDQKQIIYIEDPFGNIVYEKREKLSQEIDKKIDFIKNKQNTYLILTSRKDIFREFKKDTLWDKEIEQYEKELNIVMPSYDNEQRKLILDRWAEIKDCRWYKDPELKLYVHSLIEKKENIPTPLSIHNFIQYSSDIQNKDDIDKEIKKNSESSERSFASEIIGLYKTGRKDKILLLSFILISENSDYNFLNNQYNNLKEEGYEEFSKLVEEEDRIIINNPGFSFPMKFPINSGTTTISFEHPSYRAAIPIILKNPGCNLNFCKAMDKLSKEIYSIPSVVDTLRKHFEKLPQDISNQLIQNVYIINLKQRIESYSENSSYEEYEYYIEPFLELLISNFNQLNRINKKIVVALLDNINLREGVLCKIGEEYPNRSIEIKDIFKNYILLPDSFKGALSAICWYYKKYPKEIQQYLVNLISNKELMKTGKNALIAGQEIVECYDEIPDDVGTELLMILSNYPEAASEVSWGVCDYFYEIPKGILEKIIRNILNYDDSINNLILISILHFYDISIPLRNDILKKLMEYDLPDHFYINMEKNYSSAIPEEIIDEIRDELFIRNLKE